MRASRVSLPTRSARMMNEPVVFTVAPITRLPASFKTGMDSPVIIDSSTELMPSRTAIDGDLFTWPYPQAVAGLHLIQRNIVLRAIAKNARGVGTEIEQRPNRRAGTAAGAEFE